jgi:hypothetical protein
MANEKAIKYLPEAAPYIEEVVKGLIGRRKLMRLTGANENQCKTFLQMVDKDEAFTATITNNYQREGDVISAFVGERVLNIDEYCEFYGFDRNTVKSWKLVTHTGTPYYNIAFYEQSERPLTEDFIEAVIKKHIERPKVEFQEFKIEYDFDMLTITDVHVGMTTNATGFSLYGGKWDKEELMKRAKTLVEFVISNKKSPVLIVNDLGDLLDGWNSKTVRQGHDLPQNMDNEEAFDSGLNFKAFILNALSSHFLRIEVHNVCNDNHSGAFGYTVNSALKKMMEQMYGHIRVYNHRKFIDHYFEGKHCILLSHGKDKDHVKFSFKPKLDSAGKNKIDDYITNFIWGKSEFFLQFIKGDSHAFLFDFFSSDDYHYKNYPAFSPSSEWIQTNYKKGRSGFVLEHYSNEIETPVVNPSFFDWQYKKGNA